MRPIAFLLLPLLALGSCSTLSTEQQEQLSGYQRRAKSYWEGGNLGQALAMTEKGLELDPDDYLLNSLHGAILVRVSGPTLGSDHRTLDAATEILERTFDTRSANRHEPELLFFYSLALQRQGRRHAAEALRLEAQARTNPDNPPAPGTIADLQQRSEAEYGQAEELLAILIDRGELLRLCHYHLMLAAHDRGNDAELEAQSEKYLPLCTKEQELRKAEIERTNVPGYEVEQKKLLADLRREELEVRSLLAEHYYAKEKYEAALAMLNRVLELDPRRSVDYYNRGRVLLNLGREDDAKADFRSFLATTDLPATSDKAIFAAATLSK